MPTLTLNLDDRHDEALTRLAAETDMSKTAVMRQALRLYQLVHERAKDGQQLAFTKDGRVLPIITPSLMLPPVPAGVPASAQPSDAALLDFQNRRRVEVVPEFEGGWHAAVYGEDEVPEAIYNGGTAREALTNAAVGDGVAVPGHATKRGADPDGSGSPG